MADNPRQDLYLEISRSLVERELTDLRTYVSGAKILPAGVIQNANAHQIFNQLEKENKLKPGDLSLLAHLLRGIGRHDYAKQAEKIAENERKELRKHEVPTKRPREKGMDYKAGQMKKMRGEEDKETVSKSRTPSQHDSDVMDTEADEQTSRLTSALTANYRNTLGHLEPLPWEGRFVLDLDMVFTRPELVGHGGVTLQSLDDVFDYLPVPARGMSKRFNVLVVGDAGSGKSTLFSKTALDWSRKKGKLADMNKIVLLIRLRKVKPGESIAEIVWDQCVSQSAKGISIPSIETCLRDYESDIVFLLDGYDELVSGAKEPKQAVPELLAKTRCPNCTVIVTSRPFSGIERYMQIDHKVNFMGFSVANVDAFVRLYFQSVGKPDLADSLVKALDSRAIIVDRGLIQTPMFLMLICVVWEENPTIDQFPVTMTGLYQVLLTCLIRKYCVREGLPMSNDEILPVVSAALLQLGKLALESLLRGESLVDLGKTTTNQYTDVMVNLGIVSKEVSASRLHPREQLNFPHKSMQEFLAARYVADRVNNSSDDLHSLVPLDTVSTFVDQMNLVQFIYDFGGQVASDLLQAGAVVKAGIKCLPVYFIFQWLMIVLF
ncbi:NLR family CARD domain-containing protein 4-like [Branchiostoma floridae x Branchiostoma belcheri]